MLPKTTLLAAILTAQVSYQQIINTDFTSAVAVNVCQERDGGYGPGRVSFTTRSCECLSRNTFRALCLRTRPNPREGHVERYDRQCDPRDPEVLCLPTNDSSMLDEDCECKRIPKKTGSKPPKDTDGIACSGGLNLPGPDAVTVWSTIVFTKGTPASEVQGCWVQGSGARHLSNNYPCEFGNNGHVLKFNPKETYQACIEGNDDSPARISFEWIVTSPWGHSKRDKLEQSAVGRLAYDSSYASTRWSGSVVIVDEKGRQIERFDA